MQAELQWLTDPTVFQMNRLDAHSDHVCYASREELAQGATSLRQSLDGVRRFKKRNSPNIKVGSSGITWIRPCGIQTATGGECWGTAEISVTGRATTHSAATQDTAGKLGVSPRTIERTIQMMNGLTEDTREVFHHYPQYKLSQSNAMKLSHMEPGKQKTAAILLASGQIRSADDYQPMEVRAAPGHTKSSRQQKAEFLESIAELKDPTKSCKQSPEAVVLEYSAFIEKIRLGVESFRLPNYEEVLPALSQEQLHTLICLTDSCRKTLEDYLSFVKETCANV